MSDDREPGTAPGPTDEQDAHARLLRVLDDAGARYRLVDHEPEGRTELVSALRGNDLAAAAKCMVVMVKITKKRKDYVLAVIPGDRQVDFAAIRARRGGTFAGFARPDIAEELSGAAVGTVLPIAFDERLGTIVDPDLWDHPEIWFNAGRLDRSVAVASADLRRILDAEEASISH